MVLLVQVFGLAAANDAVHVAVGGHGEVHFFHGRPLGLGRLAARPVVELHVIEQSLEPLQRSRGGRHLRDVQMRVRTTTTTTAAETQQ